MSENIKIETVSQSEKPVQDNDDTIQFPSLPDPTDKDFEVDVGEEERNHYKNKFPDLNEIRKEKLHCTACDRHLGCSARNESRMRSHPMLRTLMCHTCHTFYNSGEFEKGDDGSELYCRWCGQGGQVYCCSDCPHVFCAKCIRRNFGNSKIKEIENTDDWKCFKCNPNCLWDHRAVCWALLRFCDLRNKIAHNTEDSTLKEKYLKVCATDDSECCKHKSNKKREKESKIKKESDASKKQTANIVSKIPPSIQVKKFASIIPEEVTVKEKKAQKRAASPPKPKLVVRPPQPPIINRLIPPIPQPQINKRMKFHNTTMPPIQTVRFQQKNNPMMYTRIRPKPPHLPTIMNYNGLQSTGIMGNYVPNDNINLSLESLTQGLDMAAVAGISNNLNDDVVCTPDFPLEPLCEVNEDANDDDVQCITPATSNSVFKNAPPPLHPRISNPVNPTISQDLSTDNIIQMTENDVTVNEITGGLKFRVDPQTLSSNKMYRLPDGRIFAINPNPSMPGGYSATIVALTDNSKPKTTERYAAKLNPIPSTQSPSRSVTKQISSPRIISRSRDSMRQQKRNQQQRLKAAEAKAAETPPRNCDINVPVEWFRYNLIDAVDSLEYSLARLHRLKKEATTIYLRSRTVNEMKILQRKLDRLLSTSSTRFKEIRENLDKELKSYITKKMSIGDTVSDDDDVEILNDVNDDPIFIDENSSESTNANESNCNITENNEVDLTGPASSEHNESGDKSADGFEKNSLSCNESTKLGDDVSINDDITSQADNSKEVQEHEAILGDVEKQSETREISNSVNGDEESCDNNLLDKEEEEHLNNVKTEKTSTTESANEDIGNEDSSNIKELEDKGTDKNNEEIKNSNRSKSDDESENKNNINEDKNSEKDIDRKYTLNDIDEQGEEKSQDADMSEELIETLLNDDIALDGMEARISMDISDEL